MGPVKRCISAGAAYDRELSTAQAIAASAPSVVKLLRKNLGIKKTDITADLEINAKQQLERISDGRISRQGSELSSQLLRLRRRGWS
jgi:hypothetical protein